MSHVKDLALLNRQELRDFLKSFDTVLCDVDGVIYDLKGPIPGSKDALEDLRNMGNKIIFVTNNSINTLKDFHVILKNLGYNINVDEIINPTVAAIDYLKNIGFKKKIYLFTIQDLQKDLENAGFDVIEAKDVDVEGKSLMELLSYIENLDPEVGAVYFDYTIDFNYLALQKAVQYLKKPDVLFFATGLNPYLSCSSSLNLMGPGLFLDIIKSMTSREPILLGKPGPLINKFVAKKISCPSKSIFIGDTLDQDMKFANIYGYQSLLVFSGATKRSDLEEYSNLSNTPMYCVESLDVLGKLIKNVL